MTGVQNWGQRSAELGEVGNKLGAKGAELGSGKELGIRNHCLTFCDCYRFFLLG